MKQEMNVPVLSGPAGDENQNMDAGALNAASGKEENMSAAERVSRRVEEESAKLREAMEVMREGKGILELETPIIAGDEQITKLPYDFTLISGMEYTDAMDSDSRSNPQKVFSITYRQALNLFAVAAAKEVASLDMQDIITRIGVTDAVAAAQLATLFFAASIRAARKRMYKRSSQQG